ncbi:MAG: anaerobic ribonucleoside-triphosphate reductase activating protein [Eubacteriales bacterium]|nr:anaerobic ribonucleoside-triphosphate reductase activating protein [Eubacteriales bacterium]
MKIAGIQKVTLLDYPENIACTVFLRRCNFKCPFCHNMELVTNIQSNNDLDEDTFFQFLDTRHNKLDGVCITGGEPTLNNELINFIKKIKQKNFKVKLDTNGTKPEIIKEIINENLVDMIAMDIKSSKENYEILCGTKTNFDNIIESIQYIMNSNIDYEFRTTCVKPLNKKEDFESIANLIKGANKYFLQNFRKIENVTPPNLSSFKKSELEEFKNIIKPYVKRVEIRGVE